MEATEVRYYCSECDKKCSLNVRVDVKVENIPCLCDLSREVRWEKKLVGNGRDKRSDKVLLAMREDGGNGGISTPRMVERIDPADPWNPTVYRSINEAAAKTNTNKGSIARAVNKDGGGRLRGGDYYWQIHQPTYGELVIRKAAFDKDVEAYRKALKEHNPARYEEVFGGDE